MTNSIDIFNLSKYEYQLTSLPIIPGTLKFYNEDGYCCDDGAGNLMGTLLSSDTIAQGTIDYKTGKNNPFRYLYFK